MTIEVNNKGIEIDHSGEDCLSAVMEGGGITIDIDEDAFYLTLVETKVLCDWLSDRILDLMLEQAASNE